MHRSAVSLLQERSPSFQERLEDLTIPRTVLVGERTVVDTSGIEAANVQVKRIQGAGHSMMSENPGAFAQAVARGLGIASDPTVT